jgi:Ca2+-binding RTX toxin-like protein
VPDGTSLPLLSADQFGSDPVSYDWADAVLIHDQAARAAREAEKAAEDAIQTELSKAQDSDSVASRDSADPLDQVAADWAASINADEKIIHAFLGIDDPIGREAQALFDDLAVDAELSAFLETLPEGKLARGELAALSAFDDALASGADAEEALSAAISAADTGQGADADIPSIVMTASVESDRKETDKLDDEVSADQRDVQTTNDQDGAAPIIAPVSLASLTGLGVGASVLIDPTFGFGFTFSFDSIPLHKPGSKALSQNDRNDSVYLVEADSSIVGTSSADLLVGSSIDDVIGSKEGDDFVYTDLPNNFDDTVHSIAAPLTSPTFSASGGNDIASAGAGDDSIWGGSGNDQLHGDVPEPGSALSGEFSFPLGFSTGGNDWVDGGTGNDTIWGGDGADTLIGGDGSDILYGDGGADSLSGGAGSDNLFGYAGDDIVSGGEGVDTLAGGDGADQFEFSGGSGGTAFDKAQSLGTDTVADYSQTDNDTFALADADFALGNSGTLTDGADYFETTSLTLSGVAQDMSGGVGNSGVVVVGANTGTDGVAVYYTDNAAAMTTLNSYQIADVISVNATDLEAGDFFLT